MKTDHFHSIGSIADLHQFIRFEPPRHPLITVVDYAAVQGADMVPTGKILNELYLISLKETSPGEIRYGRSRFDFQEGCMIFMGPRQVFSVTAADSLPSLSGTGVYFHPDLLLGTPLAKKIHEYSFFGYQTQEALHLSDSEKKLVVGIYHNIQTELNGAIDQHSKAIFIQNLELLLHYCQRFCERQHISREVSNKDLVARFTALLHAFFQAQQPMNHGLVQVSYFAEQLHLSPNYLSDLLKRETGKSVKEHIHLYLLDRAKHELLATDKTVSEIAFELGFEYPQYFSKLFKQKEGLSPSDFRQLN